MDGLVNELSAPVIGFIGMSHLGLVSSTVAALHGYATVSFDESSDLVSRLKVGRSNVREPGLDEAIVRAGERQFFTSDPKDLGRCDVVYVSIDVPTDEFGNSDLAPIYRALDLVKMHVDISAAVVILSQVVPGFTRAVAWPSSRLFYQVETLVFGQALQRAMEPERLIIGMANTERGVHPAYAEFLGSFGCRILQMGYESAELAKIAINAVLVSTVSAANTMAEICEKIGANWDEIVPALRLDRRIGEFSYIEAGLGLTGGNLERDVQSIIKIADENDTDKSVPRAWIENSLRRRNWVGDLLSRIASDTATDLAVGIWGLTYKKATNSTKNSMSIALIRTFGTHSWRWFDPVAQEIDPGLSGQQASTALDAAEQADVLCVMTPWDELRAIPAQDIARAMRGHWVIDPWGLLDSEAMANAGLIHLVLGRSIEAVGRGHLADKALWE